MNATSRAAALSERYDGASAEAVLAGAVTAEFPGRVALVSSFGTESAVLLHMIAAIDKALPVIFLDTGKLFGETRRYRDQLIKHLGLTGVLTVAPMPEEIGAADADGVLWTKDPDACCEVRKVRPLERALAPFDAWITGRKGYQAATRAELALFEADQARIKINPLAGWTRTAIADFLARHALPRHPLEGDGYPSIGCLPCTTRVLPGEDARAGRWRGKEKTECGIHLLRAPAGAARTAS